MVALIGTHTSPSDMLRHVRRTIAGPPRQTAVERGLKIGGWTLLALTLVGFVLIFPELRRYVKIERM